MLNLLWVILILYSLTPLLQRRYVEMARLNILRGLQARRKSRVITMIHRQEAVNFLGIAMSRFIDIDDSEEILRAIRLTPPDVPIDLILHTPGGLVLAVEQIARAIRSHPSKVTVMVPHYAMSGGTLLALAADEILTDEHAVLGPVDPQLGDMPAVSLLKVVDAKPVARIDDRTLVLADIARKAIRQVRDLVVELVADRLGSETAERIADQLTGGEWTHDYPITCSQLRAMGLEVMCGLPREVYTLMRLYPQPAGRRPSVQYVPISDGPSARVNRN